MKILVDDIDDCVMIIMFHSLAFKVRWRVCFECPLVCKTDFRISLCYPCLSYEYLRFSMMTKGGKE